MVKRPAIVRVTNLREPALTGDIAAQADPLFTLADQTISRSIPAHIRRDAVVMLATALWLGEVKSEDVVHAAKIFVRPAWKENSADRRFVSLDAPAAFRDGKTPLVETISIGDWSQPTSTAVVRAGGPGTPGALIRNWIGCREHWGWKTSRAMFPL